MGSATETFGQRIISRRPLSRFIQIDRLVTVLTGAGTQTTPAIHLPHARYTVFPEADPERAARSFAFVDQAGYGVRADWSNFPPDVLGLSVPLVQHELNAGSYRLTIETASPTCAWRVQVVLNSMLSWAAPPPAWRQTLPPPAPIVLRRGDKPAFRVDQTGPYVMKFVLDGFDPGSVDWRREIQRMCPFELNLRAADGHMVHLGRGTEESAEWPTGAFLGAGGWSVEIDTAGEWQLSIAPQVGPSGGGTRWF